MELRHLASFVAVAEQLSFVRAAEKLHLSQPALSAQIQKLEEEIGVQLLFRNKRTVRLTDAGRVFLAEAHATLARAQQAVERVQKADRGEIGRLRIGFVSSAALAIVPAIAVAFRRQFPGVTLDLMNLRTSSQLKNLANKTIDVGFLRLPVAHDQLDITVIHREPFVVVLPADHALAKKKQIRLSDLRAERFVAYGRRWAPGFYDAVVQMCTSQGFSPNITQETGEMYTAIALVAAGAGVAILPKTVVLAQSQGMVMKPLPLAAGVSEIAIAVRKKDRSPLVDSFVQLASGLGKTISSNR
ncbi:MAG TPA: LysR substrate-binding domain-containing protein [Edaphobacter sp.]|nr:LysR substrate-binding domain-containing protein [Edaphobacter sp.]